MKHSDQFIVGFVGIWLIICVLCFVGVIKSQQAYAQQHRNQAQMQQRLPDLFGEPARSAPQSRTGLIGGPAGSTSGIGLLLERYLTDLRPGQSITITIKNTQQGMLIFVATDPDIDAKKANEERIPTVEGVARIQAETDQQPKGL